MENLTWQTIETAPRDGSRVRLRRVLAGTVIFEGEGVFDHWHDDSPYLAALSADPLGRMSAEDYRAESVARSAEFTRKRWLRADRMRAFPTPTHWAAI